MDLVGISQSNSESKIRKLNWVLPNKQCANKENTHLIHWGLNKMAGVLYTFSWKKMVVLLLKYNCSLFLNISWKYARIGSGNGLVPKWWQVITWISNDPLHWCQDIWFSIGHWWISLTRGHYFAALIFPLLPVWIRSWTNGLIAGDLQCHDAQIISFL